MTCNQLVLLAEIYRSSRYSQTWGTYQEDIKQLQRFDFIEWKQISGAKEPCWHVTTRGRLFIERCLSEANYFLSIASTLP